MNKLATAGLLFLLPACIGDDDPGNPPAVPAPKNPGGHYGANLPDVGPSGEASGQYDDGTGECPCCPDGCQLPTPGTTGASTEGDASTTYDASSAGSEGEAESDTGESCDRDRGKGKGKHCKTKCKTKCFLGFCKTYCKRHCKQ
jgi:hypothetical protein